MFGRDSRPEICRTVECVDGPGRTEDVVAGGADGGSLVRTVAEGSRWAHSAAGRLEASTAEALDLAAP